MRILKNIHLIIIKNNWVNFSLQRIGRTKMVGLLAIKLAQLNDFQSTISQSSKNASMDLLL